MSTLAYHQVELAQALASPGGGWNRPVLTKTDCLVLDIGCGAGQSFIAWAQAGQLRDFVGMDIDESAIVEGKKRFPIATFLLQGGERIPYPADTFDLVMSRVSLVYCNIPKTLAEIHRTLKRGGRIWFTLHTRAHAENCMRRSQYSLPRKMAVRFNAWLLRSFGFVVPIRGRYESWQDPEAFLALLWRFGFDAEAEVGKNEAGDDVLKVQGVKR